MADNDNRYRLWQTISKEYDLPDYNQFSKDMEDATKRKSLHDAVSAEYDLPDFDQFSKDMGYGQQTTQQGNQNTQNGKKPQQTTQSSQVEEGRGVLGDNGYNKQKIAHEKEASQAWNNLAYKGGIRWKIEGHPEVKMVAVTDDLVKRFPQLEQSREYQVPFNMSTGTPIMQNIDDKGNIITPDEASEQYTKILTNQDFDYVPKQETAAVQIGSVVNTALSTKGGWLDRMARKNMAQYGDDWEHQKFESDGKEVSASEVFGKVKQTIYDYYNSVLKEIRSNLMFNSDEEKQAYVDNLYKTGQLKEEDIPKANVLHYVQNVDKEEQKEAVRQRILDAKLSKELLKEKYSQLPKREKGESDTDYQDRVLHELALSDIDLRKLDTQINQYKAVWDELQGNNTSWKEWGHAFNTSGIGSFHAWDLGATDLKDAIELNEVANDMKRGKQMTSSDYMALRVMSQANEADAIENAVMPVSYKSKKGSFISAPFTFGFFVGGKASEGVTSAVNKVVGKVISKTVKGAVLKAGGKKALSAATNLAEKAANTKCVKLFGMLAKDFEKAALMENTTGAATTGAEILNRHIGTVSETDDGFKIEGESLPTAIIKGEMSQNIELQTEFLGEHFPSSLKFIRGMAHTKVGSAMGLRNLAAWLTKVSRMEFATTLKSYATRAGINGVFGEYLEEVAGTAENALLVGDQMFSDLLDVKQQEEVAGSVVLSCLGMGIFGTAIYTGQRGLNMPSYYRLQHLQNKWDNAGLDLFTGEEWAKWKDRIDNTPNEGMKSVMADILRADNMTEEQARAAFNYARCSLTLRGMNIGAIKAAQLGLTDDRSIEQDNAYVEGRQAKDEEKHDIQIEFEDRSHELAEKLGITEQQLDNMSDEELESLTGKDDQLDNLIYDYQTSHAKYQGVVDNADDEIDKAAQEAARQTDMATDKSRGTVRNATIKATKGEEDYGVYIVSGNVATNEDGSINVGESDDMILYYDPKTGKIEHCDALRLAALGEEVNAEETRNQAIADAKEKAIRKQAGIIDGTVGEGITFTITDAQGVEHTYEVLAENGDGSAMITLDGNVQETPVSLQDLQNLKDAEDAKSLEAAKMQRQQYEEEREKQNAPVEDNLDYADIINTDGKVEIADVVDEEGNPMFPDAEEVFFVQNQGNRAKVMVLDNEGNLKAKLVDKSAVQSLGTMSVDEYKQERQKTLKEAENESEPSLVDETETSNNVVPTDNVATDNTTTNETQPGNEAEVTTPNETQNEGDLNASNEQESTPKITLEDGTEVPMLEDGNPDFSQLTAGQVAELYDTQFGEDAGQIITNNVDRSKKALDKANAMTVQGGSFVEQKASKEAKDKAIAEAQAKYDSAKAIEDAYNERMLAKEEDTPEGRRNLIEKARRKFNRMKSSVKDNAQAVAQLYNETVGSLLHRLYDSTGIDVFDDTANTVDEYVASSIAPYSLNYEGTETSKGVKQETGLSRTDFVKTGFLAKEGKGKTIDQLSNDLWRDRPENLQNITDQDVRNAIIDLITSGQTAFGLKNHIQNLRIAEAENILEQQKRQADELAHAEKQKEEESQSTGMVDNNAEDASNADVTPADEQAEDNLSDMPFEAPSPDEDAPFSAKDKAKDPLEVWNNMTDEEKAAYIEQNLVKDTRLVDDVVGKKLRKAIEKIAGMMGANIQWQRTDMIRNGWFNPTTKTIYLALDSSILEGVQFVFGHEMTHDIKKKSPAMYDELKGLVKEKYGEELFESMTDDNEQRYADVDKTGNDRSYYEEETVADAIGKMINDLNLTRSIALKMSHPLLAKIHDVLLKVKNALMATPYTDDVKGIIRTIEQVYVKTANGTFESSASEGTNDEQFGVRDANERFNNEIENFKNKSHKGLLHLGTPSPILKACGVDVDEITLSPKVLNRKLNQHSLTTEDVKDLVNAIQKPIMVYKHGEEAPNIVVITNADIRGNKLSLSLELDADGNVTKLNNVSSIHDKDAETEINRWLSWDEGYWEKALRWVDKEKVSDWLSSARLNSYSQTENNQKLSSIAKILNDFENPNISEENISNDDENVSYSLRQKPEPEKKGIGYKVFVLGKDGKLYPPMVANPNGAATPVGVWLDADAAPIAGESKTGRPQVKQGGKGTQGGSGKLAYRPGWHLGVIPYAIQFNRKDAEGNKTLFPKNFVFAEVEYAADKDYQDEAHTEGINGNGNYQHSLAGLKHLPTDGYYMYRTNPNPETDPWVITGAMKVNRLLTRAEQADIVRKAGREPQKIQEGDIVTDDVVNSINQEIAAAPKFSLKVYHGSGADFTEFDFDHMGEGAGSQAFGWGGYVTSSKKIGKSYADLNRVRNLPEDIFDTENKKAAASYVQKLITQGYDKESAIQEVRSKYEGFLDNLNRDKTSRKNNGVAILNLKERIATLDEIEEGKLPLPKVSLYEVEIPEDNGSNYLEWEEKPSDEVATKIIEGLYGLDAKTLDDMASKDIVFRTLLYDYIKNADKRQMIPLLVKTHALTRGTTYDNGNAEDDIRFVYTRLSNWMGSPKAASQFLFSIGYTGIKYPAGTIMGGTKEGDMNYVIFKPEDMQIVEHEKFSVKKMIFDPREISDTEKQRRGDMLIHATPVDVAKDQIIKTENLSARKVAEQWWRKNIGSPLYYETEIGKVEINENSIQSSLAHRYGQAKLDAITSLKDGFNNAVYLGTIPDFVRTRDNVQNHYFAYPINYDGKRCYVFCRAMEDANKNSLYVHEVFVADNIQKEGNTLQTAAFKPHGGIALYKHILSDVLSAANVDNSSETSKQNGEKFSLRLQDAINETDTEPTEAQKKSGNYKKGHVKFGGYDYTIENPKGSYRSGVDENGKEWKQKMNDTYGYIRGKFGKDGDHLDMFINDNADLDNWNGDVFVVDQVNPDGKFDEHKVMYGYDSLEEAKKAYLSNYEKGWTGLGNITPVSKADFDKWLDKSNRKLKPFADYADITSKTDMDTAPSSFEEFLDVVRYSIRNEKERAAAEDAYNFAQENRPDRYSRYAIVNMEKPGAVPQYLEKKTAADNWRRYYNKLKRGNYKLFDLDKPFEDNVKNLVGKFPETFRKKNDTTLSKINELTADYNKRKEEYDAMSNSIQELLNGLMKQGRSLAEAESVIRDWGLYKEMDSKYQNLMGIRKQLNELRSGKVADGERYSLIGKKGAANLDHEEEVSTRLGNLNVARQMENTKKDAKAIKMATGWERGADGKWRYEIPDAKLSDMTDIDGKGTMVKRNTEDMLWTSGKLGDKVDAPSLFKAYPDLKDVRLETDAITNGLPSNGSFNPKINTITIHANNLKYLNSILNHEIQHAIQHIEGFARGGNPEYLQWRIEAAKKEWRARVWADALRDKAEEMGEHHNQVEVEKALMDEYKEMGMDNDEWMPDKETRIKGFNYFARGYADRSFDNDIRAFRLNESTRSDYNSYVEYTKLGGEVEARNVQSRMNMSPEERRKILAEETEDVARKDQIFLYGDNDAYSLKQNKDAEYLEAVKNGDMEKAQKMVYDAARAAGYVNGTDYQGEGSWNAPSASVEKKDFANLDALRESVEEYSGDTNVFGIINGVTTNDDDFYYNPGRVGFRDAAASETSSVLRRLRYDKADANTKVKVYRTVPADVKGNKLMSGDWIALSKQYCIEHGNGRYGEGGYRIIEEEVPIKTIWNDGNDMREFGFDDGNNNEAEKNVPNNRKLLDAVTYDNNGNVIPLSERFNESNDDIRYSLKDEKTLAGVHNITEEKLRKVLKLGGFANPSLAVIDTNKTGHDNFGEISFIAPSALVDKESGHTAGTWTTDAYTQRYPSVERQMSDKGYDKFCKWVDGLDFTDSEKAEIKRQTADALEDNREPAWELMYLKEKGIDIKAYSSDVDYGWESVAETYGSVDDVLKAMEGDAELDEKIRKLVRVKITSPLMNKIRNTVRHQIQEETGNVPSPVNPAVRKRVREIFDKEYAPKLFDENGQVKSEDVRKIVGEMLAKYNDTKRFSFQKAKVRASTYVHNNGMYTDYLRWQEEKLDDYGTKGRIFRGYKNDGTRKYVPETLENVSKAMREEADGQTNGSEYTSFGSFIAKLASRVDSTDEMRANKDKLSSNEDKKKFYEKWNDVYYDLAKFLYNDVFYGEQRLHDIVLQSDPKKYAKKEYGITLTPTFMKKLDALKNAIRTELKSAYFETKYNRPLRLNEFAAAVVPDNLGEDVRKGIENAGLPMYDYDPNKEGDRSRAFNEAINSSDNIRFSLKSMMEKPEGWKQANKKAIHIAEAIERDPKFSLKNLDGTLIKAGTYFSGGGLVEEGLKGIIDPVVAVEYDEKISGVYRNNFGNHIVTADVRDVDPKELVDKIDGDVEYFHASPVCKNYSQAKNNHEELELDKETAASTAEFISKVRPKVVTIENVKGYKDSEAMKTITDALDEAGYKWDANVYNAADYGGYTNRERLIVRAVLDGELPPVPKTQKRKSGWYEAVEDIIPTLTEKKNGVASWMDERLKADGIDWRHINKPLYVMGSGYANGTVPHAFADELLPTLRTKSGDVIVMPDGKVYRAMGRVLARVSGVSDDYQMPASEALSHTIIGNGIPTQLTENVIAPLVRDVLHPAVEERASLKDVNEEEKYSLRVDRYRDELNQWKKDNNLPKDAERPQLPVREPNESAADFLKRVKEYRKQAALWATAPTYEDHLLTSDTAQGQFNLEMQRKAVLTRIVVQDSMLAIRKAQEAIMKEHGVDKLNSAEDAYTAENRSHGKAKNEFEEYNDEFLQPLRKAYNELMLRLGKSYDNVKVYMIAKHGLERNAHIAFKYALDEDFETNEERMDAYNNYKSDMDRLNNDADFEAGRIDFATWKQRDGNIRTKYAPSYFKFRFDENGITKDYSGLSALFDADDFEGGAADLVKDVEDANPYFTDELWYATNDATKKILRDSYNAGMMTEDNFNFVSGMYRNYIPLRGWGDTNADQVWNYVGGGKGAFSQVVKEAKGRKSLADDPIAYIENMAESAILMNNRNWVKQHLLLLAQNHRTSLLHVSKAWYIKTKDAQGNEEWIPASPQITEGMTSRQVELALEAFEQKMEQMKQNGEATQKREHLEISYPQTNGEEREHEVRVMKGGEEFVIYVNGDPQLAQAVNNTRARKVREGLESSLSAKVIARTGRYMAAAYTSMSPLFIPSNYMRDLTMTLASTAIREDARYNYLLRRNMLRHWNTFPMVLSYQNGTLREKVRNGSASEVEKMFYDFMMNGGETGFVTSLDVEDLKKKFRSDLKDLNRMAANPKKVGHIIMDSIETLNRAIEDSNRFMVYMTSIQYGRSIEEAVNNAKDVTLNFNRKGTGEHWMQNIRNLYLFINPAIQSLQTLGALAKHHRFKFTAVTTGWLASGLLAPMLNNLLMSFFGGDDDKDKYWQFTKWDRRNNFIMWIPFTNEFVKIPLAQEFRGFYGVGDMIASKLWGGEKAEESWRDYAVDLAGQIVDMLPLDPTGYDGNIGLALTPNVARPIGELALNVDFTGKPIFKDSEYNKYDPNFTKAYVGTPDWLVRISKMVNSIDNKYPDVQQNAIDRFGDPRFNPNNPAVIDHLLSSYLGGSYTMGSQILGVATKALNGDDIKMADIPLASKFVSNPDDRPVSKKQGEEFWDMKERHDRAANTLSKLKQKAKVDGDYSTLDIFFGSDEYRQYKEDDKKVKKYEEDRKKEKAQETGEEYRPHKTTADDVYKSHATPKDDFEDMKMKQLYEKLNSYKIRYEAIDGISSEKGDAYYKANKAAIDAIEEIAYDKSMISTIKKGFLSDGQDSYDADGMKDIREMRKRILDVLEKANKTMMNNRK